MIARLLVGALDAVRYPQTATEPATAFMREGWLRFQSHLPYASAALVLALLLLLAIAAGGASAKAMGLPANNAPTATMRSAIRMGKVLQVPVSGSQSRFL